MKYEAGPRQQKGEKKFENLEQRIDNRGRKPMAQWSSPQAGSEENRKL